jgi:hypothetical protein
LTIFRKTPKYCLVSSFAPSSSTPITLCRYWVKPEKEAEFRKLLDQHWPLFRKLGLVADEPAHLVFRGTDKARGIFYVEIFPWKDGEAAQRAHSLPEVAAVWEPMGGCCTELEFPEVEQIA